MRNGAPEKLQNCAGVFGLHRKVLPVLMVLDLSN